MAASYDSLDYKSLFRSINRDQQGDKPEAPRGMLRGAGDLGIELASGVARGVKFTADAFGAGNAV
jgi:hypothetical protein